MKTINDNFIFPCMRRLKSLSFLLLPTKDRSSSHALVQMTTHRCNYRSVSVEGATAATHVLRLMIKGRKELGAPSLAYALHNRVTNSSGHNAEVAMVSGCSHLNTSHWHINDIENTPNLNMFSRTKNAPRYKVNKLSRFVGCYSILLLLNGEAVRSGFRMVFLIWETVIALKQKNRKVQEANHF